MGPHDDTLRKNQPEDSSKMNAEEEQAITTEILHDEGGGTPWPTAEGYTPLTDMMNHGSVFMAAPPSSMDDDDWENNNTFESFALEASETPASVDVNENNDSDFRNLADQALMALELEYEMVLRGEKSSQAKETPVAQAKETPDLQAKETPVAPPLDDLPKDETTEESSWTADFKTTTIMPPVDSQAITKVFQGGKDAQWKAKFQDWQSKNPTKLSQSIIPLDHHSIIPTNALQAFRKKTAKARRATQVLSRSATLAEAVQRWLPHKQNTDNFVIHLIGVDAVECESSQRIHQVLGPLIRWLGSVSTGIHIQKVHLVLIGPNLPPHMVTTQLNLLQPIQQRTGLLQATAECVCDTYHEYLQKGAQQKPEIIMAFHAGIWGYQEWRPTLQYMLQNPPTDSSQSTLFVVTSYTIEEAEDDYDVVAEELAKIVSSSTTTTPPAVELWKPQLNSFASQQKRKTATALPGRDYRENAAWQAWKLF